MPATKITWSKSLWLLSVFIWKNDVFSSRIANLVGLQTRITQDIYNVTTDTLVGPAVSWFQLVAENGRFGEVSRQLRTNFIVALPLRFLAQDKQKPIFSIRCRSHCRCGWACHKAWYNCWIPSKSFFLLKYWYFHSHWTIAVVLGQICH